MVDQETLVKEINELSESIRKKNRALKMGISEREKYLESTFEPIITPLKKLSNNMEHLSSLKSDKTGSQYLIKGKHNENGLVDSQNDNDLGKSTFTDTSEEDNDEVVDEEEVEQFDECGTHTVIPTEHIEEHRPLVKKGTQSTRSNLSILAHDFASKGILARKYLLKMLHSAPGNRKYHVYGVRLSNDVLMVGNSKIDINDDDDNFNIKGKLFKGTPGLYELLFKTSPTKYSSKDLNNFKSILKITNAHKKNYCPTAPIHRNNSLKYKKVVSKIFPPNAKASQLTGKGMIMKNSKEPNIIYYNDINKLVNRLELLYEAKIAGHTGVDNEILALTEELRSKGYIA